MAHSVKLDNKGMSFLEVMIATVFLMVVSLALVQTSLLGFQENLRNSLREEAVRIADQRIGDLRTKAFTETLTDPSLNAGVTASTVTRNLRSFQKDYSVTTTVTDLPSGNPTNKQITVKVDWTYKGSTFSHSTTVILGKK
jgi:type IV pilus assembly protein PilV